MKKFFSIFFLGLFAVYLSAQTKPTDYSFSGNRLAKTLDQTPASNTIEKILIENNVIWLATGNGLSKSADNGDSWTNYYNSKDFGTEFRRTPNRLRLCCMLDIQTERFGLQHGTWKLDLTEIIPLVPD
ncbi:MAG: hypothetical protein M1495_04620 [Bacteroidetes bacterium]|nr:hypothetical protein [Bacteroidota bacterium]